MIRRPCCTMTLRPGALIWAWRLKMSYALTRMFLCAIDPCRQLRSSASHHRLSAHFLPSMTCSLASLSMALTTRV